MKKILVTGCAGFIGSNLTINLVKAGHEVTGVDNLSFGFLENLDEIKESKNFKFINHDITLPYDFGVFDEIYNFACPASPIAHAKAPFDAWRASTFGVFNMLEVARKNPDCYFSILQHQKYMVTHRLILNLKLIVEMSIALDFVLVIKNLRGLVKV